LFGRAGEGNVEAEPFVLLVAFCDSVIGVTRPLMVLKLEFPLFNSFEKDSPSVETMLMLELKFIELLASSRLGFFGEGKNTSGRLLWRVRPRVVLLTESGSDATVLGFDFDFTDASSSSFFGGAGAGSCFEVFKNPSNKSMLISCCTTSRLRSLP